VSNWALFLHLIKGVSLGFEIVEDGDESFFVIDLLIVRLGIAWEPNG
jgi:hypothetical protein